MTTRSPARSKGRQRSDQSLTTAPILSRVEETTSALSNAKTKQFSHFLRVKLGPWLTFRGEI